MRERELSRYAEADARHPIARQGPGQPKLHGSPRTAPQNWTLAHLRILCTALWLSPLALTGCATDTNKDVKSVPLTECESRIVFPAANANADERNFYKFQTSSNSGTVEVGSWTSSTSEIDRAKVYYLHLAPRTHFRTPLDLDDAISTIPDFEGYHLERGEIITASGDRGVVASQLLYLDDIVTCVAFTRYWGIVGGAAPDGGTQTFFGYYCVDPGEDFTVATARDVLSTLEVGRTPNETPGQDCDAVPPSAAREQPRQNLFDGVGIAEG